MLALVVLGVAFVGLAMRDIWQTLFHPMGVGNLNRWIMRSTWITASRLEVIHPGPLSLAGPIGLALVVSAWFTFVTLGCALIYLPFIPAGFAYQTEQPHSEVIQALYFSLVSVSTVGYGDMSPSTAWLQIVVPLQAVSGFVILTAALSWLTSLYPALQRRRHLIGEVRSLLAALDASHDEELIEHIGFDEYASRIEGLAADARQFPTVHFFPGGPRERRAFVDSLESLFVLAERVASQSEASPAHRLHASLLVQGLDGWARAVAEDFLLQGATGFADLLPGLRAELRV